MAIQENHSPTPIVAPSEQKQSTSREVVAQTKAALQSLEKTAKIEKESIEDTLKNQRVVTEEQFDALKTRRQNLNQINQAIDNLKDKLEPIINIKFKGKLTDDEKNTIAKQYDSNRFTQAELAEQYGVNQSTISDIVRPKGDNSTNS